MDSAQLQATSQLCSSRILASLDERKKLSRDTAALVQTAERAPVPHCKQLEPAPDRCCSVATGRSDSASLHRCSLADRKYLALRSALRFPARVASTLVHSFLRRPSDRSSIQRQSR